MTTTWSASDLDDLPTLSQGQCCNLKVDTGTIRVWLCRVAGGVTIEQYKGRSCRWETVAGGCDQVEAEAS